MLAKQGQPFDSADHVFEIKWDGLRTTAFVDADGLRLVSRGGFDTAASFPDLEFLNTLPKGTVLDGEIVVLVEGRPSFAKALSRSRGNALDKNRAKAIIASAPATFVVFDQLYDRFENLCRKPLIERRKVLSDTVAGIGKPSLAFSDGMEGDGKAFYASVVAEGLEGVMAKRRDSFYTPGKRSDDWLKIKPRRELLCVVIGYIPDGKDFKSLIIAAEFDKTLRVVGKVGSGISERDRAELLELLKGSEREQPLVECSEKGTWVEPGIFVQVSYHEFTEGGDLRAPVFERRIEQ